MLGMYDYTINDNGVLMKYGKKPSDYQTDVLATFSSNFIVESEKQNDEEPFFLFITPIPPHAETGGEQCSIHRFTEGTIRPPERYKGTASDELLPFSPSFNETDTSDKPEWVQNFSIISQQDYECINWIYQNRIESLRAVDDLIDDVINTLKRNEEYEKTVLIFTSDNGFLHGEHRQYAKYSAYEESIRVPLFISAPGYRNSQATYALTINNDLAPTILEFARVEPDKNIDGRSLIPLLENPNEQNWRKQFLIEFERASGFKEFEWLPSFSAIRTPSQIYIEYNGNSKEFYDIIDDPFQLNNLYPCSTKECSDQMKILQALLFEMRTCHDGTCKKLENKILK